MEGWNSDSCEPLGYTLSGKNCTLPKISSNVTDELDLVCTAGREIVAISWITLISCTVLFFLWMAIIVQICRSRTRKIVKL